MASALLLWGASWATAQNQPMPVPGSASIQSVRSARDAGKLSIAAAELIRLDDESDADLSVDFVLLARAAMSLATDSPPSQTALQPDEIDQLFSKATRSMQRSEATAESAGQRLLIRLAVANHFATRQQQDTLVATLGESFDELSRIDFHPNPDAARALLTLAMSTAWQTLNQQRPDHAESLYARIVTFADSEVDQIAKTPSPAGPSLTFADRSLAMLGWGWATAMQPDRQRDASDRLGRFVDAFPQHEDAAKAMAMKIKCLRLLDHSVETDSSNEIDSAIADFLRRWPQSPFAAGIASEAFPVQTSAPKPTLAIALEQWILVDGDPQQWPVTLISQALLWMRSELPPQRFHELMTCLSKQDDTGQRIAELLHSSESSGDTGFAEQVAATLISGDLVSATPMAIESACRWAGRTGRWAILAMAAESLGFDRPQHQPTVHVERLFAESLTQTGQTEKAYRWWIHVVDRRGANDFATLLRCAEAAVRHGEPADALRRVEQVSAAIHETSDRVSSALVDLLAADLAVRRVDFSEARDRYERVVRSPDAPAKLRSRAQWMIGETFFMQRQYRQAIDSYRSVEGLDPGGAFVAGSLVQAGKSFEQLGLTREAGDCYSALLGRFADSAHASEARQRMAVLPSSALPAARRSNRQSVPANGISPDAKNTDSPRLRR